MKIGLVRRGYSATGGAEAYLKRFAQALLEKGHTCLLFTSADWPAEAWPGGDIHRLSGSTPLAFADALAAAHPRSLCDYLFSLERVWECDCYRAGDGVHRAWLERRKAIEPFWKPWTRLFNRKHRQLLTLEENLFAGQRAGAVIANCQMVREEIIQQYQYPAERIHVVHNGLPPFQPAPQLREATRRQLGLKETDTVILFAGSGWERKGLRAAIEGVKRADFRPRHRPLLLVAGRGNPRRYPVSERVRFLGPVKEMASLYAAADLFLLPTLYDPFSNACLEALWAGLPVITTAANGFSEILTPGVDGEVLADPTDPEAIARAIEAWSDPARRIAIRPHLAELAARFTIEANVQATLRLLRLER